MPVEERATAWLPATGSRCVGMSPIELAQSPSITQGRGERAEALGKGELVPRDCQAFGSCVFSPYKLGVCVY